MLALDIFCFFAGSSGVSMPRVLFFTSSYSTAHSFPSSRANVQAFNSSNFSSNASLVSSR